MSKRMALLLAFIVLLGRPALLSLNSTHSGRWHSVAAASASPSRVLFVFRDAGESYALVPVLRRLNKEGLVATGILTGGGTAPAFMSSEPGVSTLASLNVTNTSGLVDRNATLPEAAVLRILALAKPTVLVTGVVSAVQLQLARAAIALPGVHLVAGYDDGLSTADTATAWPNVALRSGAVHELWVVAQWVALKDSKISELELEP